MEIKTLSILDHMGVLWDTDRIPYNPVIRWNSKDFCSTVTIESGLSDMDADIYDSECDFDLDRFGMNLEEMATEEYTDSEFVDLMDKLGLLDGSCKKMEERIMRKYVVVRTEKDGTRWESIHDTLEEANEEAESVWDHLTYWERKRNTVDVGWVENTPQFFEPEDLEVTPFDWNLFHDFTGDDECVHFC